MSSMMTDRGTWRVEYVYDGGAGAVDVQADSAEQAAAAAAPRFEAKYKPGAACSVAKVYRVLTYAEVAADPTRGIRRAWVRPERASMYRDRFLVVLRGRGLDETYRQVGMVVAAAKTMAGAKEAKRQYIESYSRLAVAPVLDVVDRAEVEIVDEPGPGYVAGPH